MHLQGASNLNCSTVVFIYDVCCLLQPVSSNNYVERVVLVLLVVLVCDGCVSCGRCVALVVVVAVVVKSAFSTENYPPKHMYTSN